MSASITRATAADVAAIAPLFDAYRAFFTGGNRLGESRSFLEERIARDESIVFLAREESEDGEAVGFVQLYPLWSSWYCRRIWFLSDLYVTESARKRGIGRQLVERVIDYARETNAASVMVELPRREPHLEEFYRRLGFVRDAVFELARYTAGGA
jgi:GNAT superfamily N-acetyltransferase